MLAAGQVYVTRYFYRAQNFVLTRVVERKSLQPGSEASFIRAEPNELRVGHTPAQTRLGRRASEALLIYSVSRVGIED
jgi:hypothetical protein